MDIEAAVKYPTRGEDWIQPILIGGGLVFVSFLLNFVGQLLLFIGVGALLMLLAFVPNILSGGYLLRIARTTIAGSETPPPFEPVEDLRDLFVDGGRLLVLNLVYQIPVFVVAGTVFVLLFVLQFGLSGAAAASDSATLAGAAGASGFLLIGVAFLVIFALSLLVGYFFPIGACALAHTDELSAAFEIDRLRTVSTSRTYALNWLVALGISLLVAFVTTVLALLIVGLLVWPFLFFANSMIVFRLYSLGYREALELDEGGGSNGRPSA